MTNNTTSVSEFATLSLITNYKMSFQVFIQVFIKYFKIFWGCGRKKIEEKCGGGGGGRMDTSILTIRPWAIRKNNKTYSGNSLLLSYIIFNERV